jgi:hypothetical protein
MLLVCGLDAERSSELLKDTRIMRNQGMSLWCHRSRPGLNQRKVYRGSNNLETEPRIKLAPAGEQDWNAVCDRVAASASRAADRAGLKSEAAVTHRTCEPAQIFGLEDAVCLAIAWHA